MRGYNLCVFLITAIVVSQLDSSLAKQCINCTSPFKSSEACLANPSTQNTIECTNDCFTSINADGTFTRGCSDSAATCSLPSCMSCNGDKCNTNRVCQQCLGTEDCATTTVNATKYSAVCSTDSQVCVNQVNDNQTVTRQCGTACADGSDNAKCSSCSSPLCNSGYFPESRRQCYTCSGEGCDTVGESMIGGCTQTDAKCFTTGTAANNMTRGCTSNTTGITCAADSTDPTCLNCDSNLCNALQYERDAGSCIVCDNCPTKEEANKKESCGQALYNQTLGCYTVTTGSTVNRGCLNKLDGECSATNSCTSCSDADCNVGTVDIAFQCIACISNEVSGCWSPTAEDQLPVVDCANGTCFSGVWNGLGVRDCFSSASQLMQYQCNANLHQCNMCTTPTKCNNKEFNGAASLNKMGFVGLLLALILALRSTL
ncbi:hypothetical protein KR084_004154 [Drosophila pseudotakahashii]|nr:hypothetical protein KR084_004154 [Drosophila pseudotakahashii]